MVIKKLLKAKKKKKCVELFPHLLISVASSELIVIIYRY